MSTKTTFKRVALVAVAALGLGVLSIAPSSAVVNSDSLAVSAATAAQTTAETSTATSATATLTFLAGAVSDSMSVTASLTSGPGTSTALPYLQLVETVSATSGSTGNVGSITEPNTKAIVSNSTSGVAQVSAKYKVFLGKDSLTAPTVAGTYVVKLTPALNSVTTGGGASTAQTITITVTTAASLDTVAASATSLLNAGETNSATVDAVVTATKAVSSTTSAATIKVSLLNAAGSSVSAESYTATITGPGTLGSATMAGAADNGATATGRAISVKNGDVVGVYADGTSGVATITISSAVGKILATETLTFHGDAKTITAKTTALTTGTVAKVGTNTGLISFTVADDAGTAITTGSYYLVSAAAATISNAYTACTAYNATDGFRCNVEGVAKGTTTVYVTNRASAAATTPTTEAKSATVPVRVGTTTPASVSVVIDKSSYAPGEKATLTVTLSDADGNVVPSGDYTGIFATGGIASSYALSASSDTTTALGLLAAVDGVKKYTLYMPNTEGSVDFTWTTGSTNAAALAGLALANQAKEGKITVDVSSTGSAAAIDAANEATDAANAATDAALAAADAADAATAAAEDASAAVATLATAVNTALGNLKKQITALTKLVNKLLKK